MLATGRDLESVMEDSLDLVDVVECSAPDDSLDYLEALVRDRRSAE